MAQIFSTQKPWKVNQKIHTHFNYYFFLEGFCQFLAYSIIVSSTPFFFSFFKVIAGQPIKIGAANNPIFKDDVNNIDNPLYVATKAAKRMEAKVKPAEKKAKRRSRSRSRDRGRRRRSRRRRRRRRSPSRSESDEEDKPEMFWDGYQWHFNDTKTEDIEQHVTSIIRSNEDAPEAETDTNKKMQTAAQEALKKLQMVKGFGSY